MVISYAESEADGWLFGATVPLELVIAGRKVGRVIAGKAISHRQCE